MRYLFNLLISFVIFPALAQVAPQQEQEVEIDSLAPIVDPMYREDQLYASISYNLVQNKPGGYQQNSVSTGLNLGFLRDMPLNEARTYAIAAGLGYSYNNIKHNLVVQDVAGVREYSILPENMFDKNKLVLHYVELPVEFRWRNSDAVSHKFWRVYLGFKVSYLFYDKAQLEMNGASVKISNDKNLNNFVYGAYLSTGWNTWNLYAYYGLTPIYNTVPDIDGRDVKLNSLNLGLIFYIL